MANTKEQILAFFEEQKTTVAPARNKYTSEIKEGYDWSVMNNDGICLNIPMNYEDFGKLEGTMTPAATTVPTATTAPSAAESQGTTEGEGEENNNNQENQENNTEEENSNNTEPEEND